MSPYSRIAILVPLVLALSLASATAAGLQGTPSASPTASGPHAATFADARSRATSDFERQVLADDLITYAEYQEAATRWIACMTDAGEMASTEPDPDVPYAVAYVQHLDTMIGTPGAEATIAVQDQVFTTCAIGTIRLVDAVYRAVLTNPADEDMSTLIVACLQRQGIAPASYGPEAFDADFVQHTGTPPFDPGDPRVGSCLNNPNQTGLPLQITSPDPRMLPPVATPSAFPAD